MMQVLKNIITPTSVTKVIFTKEMDAYEGIAQIGRDIIRTAYSPAVILPGVTTNEDVRHWMIQKTLLLLLILPFL